MFTSSSLAALLLLLLLLHSPAQAGRIIGGHEAKAGSRPYMVLLQRRVGAEEKSCGGFLLDQDFVLTAAHCRAPSYVAVLGLHTVGQNDVQRIQVEQDFLYRDDPEYVHLFDLMLLKLSSKATFNKQVEPIGLAEQDQGSLPGKCSVAGWGRTSFTSNLLSNKLMELNVTLINSECCAQQHFYCSAGWSGPYQGDSGGPLVCEDGKAYGVVSHMFSRTNEEPEFRFTKIPHYIEWIKLTMKQNQ